MQKVSDINKVCVNDFKAQNGQEDASGEDNSIFCKTSVLEISPNKPYDKLRKAKDYEIVKNTCDGLSIYAAVKKTGIPETTLRIYLREWEFCGLVKTSLEMVDGRSCRIIHTLERKQKESELYQEPPQNQELNDGDSNVSKM